MRHVRVEGRSRNANVEFVKFVRNLLNKRADYFCLPCLRHTGYQFSLVVAKWLYRTSSTRGLFCLCTAGCKWQGKGGATRTNFSVCGEFAAVARGDVERCSWILDSAIQVVPVLGKGGKSGTRDRSPKIRNMGVEQESHPDSAVGCLSHEFVHTLLTCYPGTTCTL